MGIRETSCRLLAAGLLLAGAAPLAAQVEPVPSDTSAGPADRAPARATYRAGVEYGYVHLSDGADPWHLASGELSRRGRGATVVGRVNFAERFGQDGVQLEADAYPRLTRRVYAYLNAGWSDAAIFPRWRFGGELYAGLPGGTEVSAGVRRLEFEDDAVTLLTGSLGRYVGSWYLSARPIVAPDEDETSVSGSVLVRRYYAGERSQATLTAGAGSSPTETLLPFELQRANSLRVGAYGTHAVRERLGLRWSAGWEREELTRTANRTRVNVGVGAEVSF